ncbi:MAG: sigma-70 family RNA polymerase sigma factor [Acidimicrobiales bacterium]
MTFTADDLAGHVDALHRYALGLTHDPVLADDAVQDTIVRALERRATYNGDAPLRHWLMRVAHNLIVDRARRSARELVVADVEAEWRDDHYTVEAEEVVERAATRDELLEALVRLPFIYRSAVVLHDIEGLRVADIAAIHVISLPAAKQRLRRGRMAMVTALAQGDRRRRATKGVPMACWDARQHISDYLNGDLDGATASGVEAHLAACPTCPPLYAALVGVHGELGRLRDPDSVIAPDLDERIRGLLGVD